ncbi:MAG: uroporphyrinogen decarboxylase family protein [Acidimicrobiales bacterium]
MLGEVTPDLLDVLGIDAVRVGLPTNFFGFRNDEWKPWTYDGTPVLVPGAFPIEPELNGSLLMYPRGDLSAPPCACMPKNGFYFDSIIRQDPLDEAQLDPADNLEEFGPIDDAALAHVRSEVELLAPTGRALVGEFGGMSFGDAAVVPGPTLAHPHGIRDLEQWYTSLVTRPDYVKEVFERQCDIGLDNLAKIHAVAGDALTAVFLTGTDFGTQRGPFISPKTYRSLFQPVQARVNDWIHTHTTWKTFIHSCGSIWRLLDDIADAGFDALNPVQTSAADMDPKALKDRYGDRLTFWGGGIDTQRVLPFGTPEEIRNMVRERMAIFGSGGGFVFNTIHNIQSRVPVANLVALFEAVEEYRSYPMTVG